MERKIHEILKEWKRSPTRKPLIVKGARQVGKTYSVLMFGKKEYKNTAYLNLESSSSSRKIFEGDLDAKRIIDGISSATGESVSEEDTLIVFDEVQRSERALTSLKYLQENAPEYHVIATGSLLGMTLNRNEYSFPVGKVDIVSMNPMDMEEFLWATGNRKLSEMISASFDERRPMPLHEKAMEAYRTYLAIGGMPEAVSEFIRTGDHDLLASVQNKLSSSYLADMAKYTMPSETMRTIDVWGSIPSQLARENKKFQYSSIRHGGRSRDYWGSVTWLESAGVVNVCRRVTDGKLPLGIYEDPNSFKLYMSDTGLLSSRYGIPLERILHSDVSGELRGAMAENYVMQSLVSNGIRPYYWSSPGKAELDFVFQDQSGDIIPVEVKSADNTRSKSMSVFISKYDVPYSIKVSPKNMGFENNVLSVPLYAAYCISNRKHTSIHKTEA
ncbi:MAG: ATP-binding protein [Candidatus Methanoplasma sp.]|nr:ATP-binding protein [Candidatus Methanoplasma sp.]